jgi:predicted phage terminase large subunit-like protein
MKDLRPQEGAQTRFLQNAADICVYGGGAGAGKTMALLLEAARSIHVPGYGAVIFRREFRQITSEGGLRDTAMQIYPNLGGVYRAQPSPHFIFPDFGTKISFDHLNQESDCLGWQGSQICLIGFDEGTHFSEFQVNYLLSRNRSTCGVRPYVRITCNPDPDSWLAKFIEWWIDQETGFPIKERGGKIRYMVRYKGERVWGGSPKELASQYDCLVSDVKSVSFVPALVTDNPILLKKDPGYLANLKALTPVERARLLDGNWKVRAQAGDYFPRDAVTIIDWIPNDVIKWVRSWDLAASEEGEGRDPDWSVGVLLGRRENGKIVVGDMIRVRRKADVIQQMIKTMAHKDGKEVWIQLPQDPGAAGKAEKESYQRLLSGFTVLSRTLNKNKVINASSGADSPAALWQRGVIEIVRAPWNKELLDELDAFPTKGIHDDIVDAICNGVRALPGHARPDYSQTGLSGRFKPIVAKPRKR